MQRGSQHSKLIVSEDQRMATTGWFWRDPPSIFEHGSRVGYRPQAKPTTGRVRPEELTANSSNCSGRTAPPSMSGSFSPRLLCRGRIGATLIYGRRNILSIISPSPRRLSQSAAAAATYQIAKAAGPTLSCPSHSPGLPTRSIQSDRRAPTAVVVGT